MHKSPASGQSPAARSHRRFRGAKVLSMLGLASVFAIATVRDLPAQKADSTATAPGQSDSPPALTASQSFDLSDEVVHDVLANFQRGMEDHNLTRVLATFDAESMKDYPRFRDQMVAFFRLHDSVKFRFQLLQVTAEKDSGFATADVEMDADPADILPTERRRTTQMRFQLKRIGAGWKVTDLQPKEFFTQ